MNLHSNIPASKDDNRYKQRKCGADFRLSVRRLWKDLTRYKRHNTPHSDRYGISGHRMCPSTGIYTKVSVVRIVLLVLKTSTFSNKDSRKTLSQYVMTISLLIIIANVRIFCLRTTLTKGYCKDE